MNTMASAKEYSRSFRDNFALPRDVLEEIGVPLPPGHTDPREDPRDRRRPESKAMPKRRPDVSRTPRHSPGPFGRSGKGHGGKGKDRNAEITAFRRTPPVQTMDVDGEDNDGDDQELDLTGDYEDDRVRDHATGAQSSTPSEEVRSRC